MIFVDGLGAYRVSRVYPCHEHPRGNMKPLKKHINTVAAYLIVLLYQLPIALRVGRR